MDCITCTQKAKKLNERAGTFLTAEEWSSFPNATWRLDQGARLENMTGVDVW